MHGKVDSWKRRNLFFSRLQLTAKQDTQKQLLGGQSAGVPLSRKLTSIGAAGGHTYGKASHTDSLAGHKRWSQTRFSGGEPVEPAAAAASGSGQKGREEGEV